MKQDVSTPSTSNKPEKLLKTKPAKDLYKPYRMPPFLWALIRFLARIVFFLVARIHLQGLEHVPRDGAFIIASNHLSWIDVPLIPAFLSRPVVYMAKDETFRGKLAWLVRFMGAFPVKRGEADRQALRAADEQLKEGTILVIFPEGTRSKTHTLAAPHAGLGMIALRSGVPIIPVAVWGSENVLKTFRPEVNVVYGEPMTFKPKGPKTTREDIDNVTQQVMQQIASMLPPAYRGVYSELPGKQE
jgi:1-acyl-sn-glycerol-3-phosphate acyltransferase